ncbi:MAG TPA: adenylate/guanylate cyclase domain-containing protein, partial [bacterium]|nr:adenylate/guanylate cyclase domain-containing protein [bacterium]
MPVFGFTDIEGSTGLWEKHKEAMGPIIAMHYAIMEQSIASHGGRIVKKTGDGIFAFFPDEGGDSTKAALESALDMQRCFQGQVWPVIGELRVRMAFHSGHAEEMDGDFYGPTANRTARFMSLGWGGQILVSEDLKKLARLPEGAEWLDFGMHQIKDLPEPQHIFGLAHPSLKLKEFPPLKSLSNRPNNLPEHVHPFVGRRRELKDLAGLLAAPHSRLVTLLGGGGMGK